MNRVTACIVVLLLGTALFADSVAGEQSLLPVPVVAPDPPSPASTIDENRVLPTRPATSGEPHAL